MNEERMLILKMLKEEKITLEEAEALLDTLKTDDESSSIGVKGDTEEKRDEGQKEKKADKKEKRKGFSFDFDLGLDGLGDIIKDSLQGIEKTVKAATKDLDNFDINIKLEDVFGKEKASTEKELLLDVQDFDRFSVKNKWGNICCHGTEDETVKVQAKITAWAGSEEEAQKKAENYSIRFDYVEKTIVLVLGDDSENKSFTRIRTDLHIALPKHLQCKTQTLGGNSHFKDINNNITAEALAGDITLKRIEGDITAKSNAGNIKAKDFTGVVEAKTTAGNIDLSANKLEKIELKTVSGNATVSIPEDSDAQIKMKTVSGSVQCEFLLDNDTRKPNKIEGKLNDGEKILHMSNVSGNLKLCAKKNS